THLQYASLEVLPEGQGLLIQRVERAARASGLGLGHAALAVHQVHLDVRRRQRAAALPRLEPARADHLH
ncbi:unnamed protein product, partial [Plutella xylostella]